MDQLFIQRTKGIIHWKSLSEDSLSCLWLQCFCLPCRMAPRVVVPESNGLQVSQGEGSGYQEHVYSTALKHLLAWIRQMMRFTVSVCTQQGRYHLKEFSPRSWNGTFVQRKCIFEENFRVQRVHWIVQLKERLFTLPPPYIPPYPNGRSIPFQKQADLLLIYT